MIFEQEPEDSEELAHADIRRSLQADGTVTAKPEAVRAVRSSKETSVAGAQLGCRKNIS